MDLNLILFKNLFYFLKRKISQNCTFAQKKIDILSKLSYNSKKYEFHNRVYFTNNNLYLTLFLIDSVKFIFTIKTYSTIL